jgi:hypothetical protein
MGARLQKRKPVRSFATCCGCGGCSSTRIGLDGSVPCGAPRRRVPSSPASETQNRWTATCDRSTGALTGGGQTVWMRRGVAPAPARTQLF